MKPYELLDFGNQRKLERFGNLIVERPAPQAFLKPHLSEHEWNQAHWVFDRTSRQWSGDCTSEIFKVDDIALLLKQSSNGQIGVFPEQITNWSWLKEKVSSINRPLRILNGFSYTGGSSLACALGYNGKNDFEICHVDASKSSVTWAKENTSLSGLSSVKIRWIVDDIVTFMKREIKRKKTYDGIILDPPAFGRTKSGKKWVLKKDIDHLVKLISQLMSDQFEFLMFSCHEPSLPIEILKTLLTPVAVKRTMDVKAYSLDLTTSDHRLLDSGNCICISKTNT